MAHNEPKSKIVSGTRRKPGGAVQLVEWLPSMQEAVFDPPYYLKLSMEAQACNPSPCWVKSGGSETPGHLPHIESLRTTLAT